LDVCARGGFPLTRALCLTCDLAPLPVCGAIFPLRDSAGSSSDCARVCSVASGALVVTSRGDEYRRRAKSCLDAAHGTENEQTRAALLRLAEDWQRMAEGWDDPPAIQQRQPKDDDKRG